MMLKYDNIGGAYNETRKADKGITQILADLLSLQTDDGLLDIGCGTGNYSNAIWRSDIKMTGLDPSELMLEKAVVRNNQVNWVKGKVEELPFHDESFSKILATLTIHHWSDLELGFKEAYRVLRPEGKMVLFTSTSEQMRSYWLNHYFPQMLKSSIEQMPAHSAILNAASKAGFKVKDIQPWSIPDNLEDQFLYCGKNNPELYFDTKIRNGISSFNALANREEVDKGLMELRRDIDSNRWGAIKTKYRNSDGDYIFLSFGS